MNYKNVAVWAATIFLAFIFVMAGAQKLVNSEQWVVRFVDEWGLPGWLVPFVGTAEILGGVLILAPKLAPYGAALIAAVMLGATGSHLMAGQFSRIGITLLFGGLAAIVANYRRSQQRVA